MTKRTTAQKSERLGSEALRAIAVFAAALLLQGATLVAFEGAGVEDADEAGYRFTAESQVRTALQPPTEIFTVTNNSASGTGSLPEAVQAFNNNANCAVAGACLIVFDLPSGAPVGLTGTLVLTQPMDISGATNPWGPPVLDFANNVDSPGNGIEIQSSGSSLESVFVQQAPWNNVLVSGSDVLISNTNLLSSTNRHGVEVGSSASNVTVQNSNIIGNAGGVFVTGAAGLTLANSIIKDNSFFNASASNGSLTLSGSAVSGATNGAGLDLSLSPTDNLTILNSTISNNAFEDVLAFGGNNVVVSGTNIVGSSSGGVILSGSQNVTITNSTLNNAGISLGGISEADAISVTVESPFADGIFINGSGTNARFDDVTISNSAVGRGIDVLDVNSLRIQNSTISGNDDVGLRLNGSGSSAFTFDNVDVTGNGGSGILIAGGVGVTVTNGTVTGNSGDGIEFPTNSEFTISGARIWNNGGEALDAGSDGNTPNSQGDQIVNYPVLLSYDVGTGVLIYAYQSESLDLFEIQVYGNTECNDNGFGELQSPLASATKTPVDLSTAVYSSTITLTNTLVTAAASQTLKTSEAGDCILGGSSENIDSAVLSAGQGGSLLGGALIITNSVGTDQANIWTTLYPSSGVGNDKGFAGMAMSDDGTLMSIDETVPQRLYLPIILKSAGPKRSSILANTIDVCLRADNVVDPSKAVIAKSTSFGSTDPWVPLNTSIDGNHLCAQTTSGGLFTIASNSQFGALPVVLSDFNVVIDGRSALITWTTASELNSLGFEIQRRARDGSPFEFEAVGFVDGSGNSTDARTYSFEVEDLTVGRHEFRLRQIDQDGSSHYTEAIDVLVTLSTSFEMTPAYPNPLSQSARFTLAVAEDQDVRVDLFDVRGRIVSTLFDGPMNAHRPRVIVIEPSNLSSGLYFYRATGANFTDVGSVMLVK